MLNVYPVILQFVWDVGLLVPRVAHHDPDLARQLRRSAASVALNTSEATYALGRTRTAAYNTALREMRESFTALEVAVRLGYLAPLDAALEDRIVHIQKTCTGSRFRGCLRCSASLGARRSLPACPGARSVARMTQAHEGADDAVEQSRQLRV